MSMLLLPPYLNVFGHCDLIYWPTEMLRTILESADYTEKEAKIVSAPWRFRHTLKMRFAEKV